MRLPAHPCPVCGERLRMRSRENEDVPYYVSETGAIHHACWELLRGVMAEHGLFDGPRGVQEALAILRAEEGASA